MITELIVILFMSIVCVGMRLCMSEGHIFSWMREPIIKRMKEVKERHKEELKEALGKISKTKQLILNDECNIEQAEIKMKFVESTKEETIKLHEEAEKLDMFKFKFLKPILICVYCFASFWGSLTYLGIHVFLLKDIETYPIIPGLIVSVFGCLIGNVILDHIMSKIGAYE